MQHSKVILISVYMIFSFVTVIKAQDTVRTTPEPTDVAPPVGVFIEIRPPRDDGLVEHDHAPKLEGNQSFLDRLTDEQERNITDRAFPLDAAIWNFTEIFVCWEDMNAAFADQREMVKKAVTDTWQAASAIEFFGWGECTEGASGIHIAVKDVGPHVKRLGRFIDAMPEGMVLNFTSDNWRPSCPARIAYCTTIT